MIGRWKRKVASRNIEHGISFLQCNCQFTSIILSHLRFLLQVDSGFLEGLGGRDRRLQGQHPHTEPILQLDSVRIF